MRYYKFPKWSRKLYPDAIWDFSHLAGRNIYLTFDDGPEPDITDFVLDLLDQYEAKATFFCLGNKVKAHPALYQEIINRGHTVGNHGMDHLNGLKTANDTYLKDIRKASELINSTLFRPAYGKIKTSQYKMIREAGFEIVLWNAMSYDFDESLSSEKRLKKMKNLTSNGSIFVFHDNKKSMEALKNDLPQLMDWWKINEYTFKSVYLG